VPRSYNGYSADPDPRQVGIVRLEVGGVEFPGGVRQGDCYTVLRWVAEQWHATVERLVDGWCWGYAYRENRNAGNLSNHASGTALDFNAPRHPNGKRGTFTAAQVKAVRRILDFCDGVIVWGEDFTGTPDGMHVEIKGSADRVAAVARKIRALEDDDMTPEQAKQLAEVHAMLKALTAPRRPDKTDADPNAISLGDVLTKIEQQ
jgi:hypothetical protein